MPLQSDILNYIHDLDDINDKATLIHNLLESALDMHAPLVVKKVKSWPCPFVTSEIKNLMKNKDNLYRIFLNTRRQADWHTYVNSRNKVKSALRKAERSYYTTLLHKLASVGALSSVVRWFESYLSNRRQVVCIGSSYSSQLPVI